MEALVAIGLASNIISFIDFGSKVINQGYEIHQSTTGATQDNIDTETLINDLSYHLEKLEVNDSITVLNESDQNLQNLASECANVARKIQRKLDKVKTNRNARNKHYESFAKAFRGVWEKRSLDEQRQKLEGFRDQLQFEILLSLK